MREEGENRMTEATPLNQNFRAGVWICNCGGEISSVIDTDTLRQRVLKIPGVNYAANENYPCSKDGQNRILQAVSDHGLNRVLIAGCTPRTIEKLFQKAIAPAGLNQNNLVIVDIREQCAYVHGQQPELALEKAASLISMGISKLQEVSPASTYIGEIKKSVLVVGSSIEAYVTALSLARKQVQVEFLEVGEGMDGMSALMQPGTLDLFGEYRKYLYEDPNIQIHTQKKIYKINGRPGEYSITIGQNGSQELSEVGALVVATPATSTKLNGNRRVDRKKVFSQEEFEAELKQAAASQDNQLADEIVMLLEAEKPSDIPAFSLQLSAALRQLVQARKLNPDAKISILLPVWVYESENLVGKGDLNQLKSLGVEVCWFSSGTHPHIGEKVITCFDSLQQKGVEIPFQRVILNTPITAHPDVNSLAGLLSLPQNEYGFIERVETHLRPERYINDGIYLIGGTQKPLDTNEAFYEAYQTTARILRFFGKQQVEIKLPVAQVDEDACTGCGTCVQACPFHAVRLVEGHRMLSIAEVNAYQCVGCGNCVVSCPVRAITIPGLEDNAFFSQINAALQGNGTDHTVEKAPKILAFGCEWGGYASAEMAGKQHIPYAPEVRIIRMNCSARFDSVHVLWAFLNGADGVLLGVCPPGGCHYGESNLKAVQRVERLKVQLAENGIDPRRLRLAFLAGDDSEGFVNEINAFVEVLKEKVV
jgi:heterodisulfide reductase subunit A